MIPDQSSSRPAAAGNLPPLCVRPQTSLLWRACLLVIVLATTAVVPSQSDARAPHPSKTDVEAIYLYNFGKFIHWPPSEDGKPLTICVLGQDALEKDLEGVVADEQIDGRKLQALRLTPADSMQSCAIVFLDSSEGPRLTTELASVNTLPVVTVSDAPGFLNDGGMIQFMLIDGRVRFAVNLNSATKSGVVLSSQLLKVAASVAGTPQGRAAQ